MRPIFSSPRRRPRRSSTRAGSGPGCRSESGARRPPGFREPV